MTEKRNYKCTNCDGRQAVDEGSKTPECCGKPMAATAEPMDQCTLSSTAEHSRYDDTQEPCDDGRAG